MTNAKKTILLKIQVKILGLMKIVSSLKSLKKRDKDCQVVRRKGKILVINKKNKRFKAKQG